MDTIVVDTADAASKVGLGMGLVAFIAALALIGLVAGALARLILPGPDPMSILATLGFGLGGSFLGGLVGALLRLDGRFSFILAVAGAMLLIWFFRRRKPA